MNKSSETLAWDGVSGFRGLRLYRLIRAEVGDSALLEFTEPTGK